MPVASFRPFGRWPSRDHRPILASVMALRALDMGHKFTEFTSEDDASVFVEIALWKDVEDDHLTIEYCRSRREYTVFRREHILAVGTTFSNTIRSVPWLQALLDKGMETCAARTSAGWDFVLTGDDAPDDARPAVLAQASSSTSVLKRLGEAHWIDVLLHRRFADPEFTPLVRTTRENK